MIKQEFSPFEIEINVYNEDFEFITLIINLEIVTFLPKTTGTLATTSPTTQEPTSRATPTTLTSNYLKALLLI